MSYDIDMCDAMTHDNGYCPLREQCKRFILGQRALMEDYYPIYRIEPCYEDGKCELFIKAKEETEWSTRSLRTIRQNQQCFM